MSSSSPARGSSMWRRDGLVRWLWNTETDRTRLAKEEDGGGKRPGIKKLKILAWNWRERMITNALNMIQTNVDMVTA
jgi:hypothetical protein